MNNITDRLPINFLVGLATVGLCSTPSSSGDVIPMRNIAKHRSEFNQDIKQVYPTRSFEIKKITGIFDETVKAYIKDKKGFNEFLDKTVLSLQGFFDIFSHKINLYIDPSEGYSQIKVTIFTMDENKVENYCKFLDAWVDGVPPEFADKIIFEIG